MSDQPTLDTLVAVSPRFARSVAVTRDAGRPDALDGYILTPNGRDVLGRLLAALRGESTTRAWSLTGPYGSGKSSLALLVAQLLAGDDGVRKSARKFLAAQAPDLLARLVGAGSPVRKAGRLFPVLVTGSRRPLDQALAASLAAALRTVATTGRRPQLIDRLERLAAGTPAARDSLAGLFGDALDYLQPPRVDAAGLLLVVDELGQFLQYGASHPDRGDVFALQELAEAATRSACPFLVVTVLHQALDRYAEHLSPGRRAEWAKVQGRFEDVAYEERAEQVLRLLSHAVRHEGADTALKSLRRQARTLAAEAVAVGVRVGAMPAAELEGCFAACHPLHPLTAALLGPLFRQLAQNERSLFAFLAAEEAHGFRAFLRREAVAGGGAYRPDELFDYVLASLGPGVFAQHRGKRWAEVQTALDRLADAGELEVRLAKTVGLLQAVGPAAGVPASPAVLAFALRGTATAEQVDAATGELVRRSVLVFRRHAGGYALWEGSDIDIEDRLLAARRAVDPDQDLPAFLAGEVPPPPLVARRHYFQTGTLRYFAAAYCGRADLAGDLFGGGPAAPGEADGRLLLCLPRDPEERRAMRDAAVAATAAGPAVAALPADLSDLREVCHELACLRWVADQTPGLDADRTARRELAARLAAAEQVVRGRLRWAFAPANPDCVWLAGGEAVPVGSARQLSDLLSRTANAAYPLTPHWRNELVNRRVLSSAAAAARRTLIEAVFERPDVEGLGFAGHPPERAMYETLLRGSRLHRDDGGRWGFAPPDDQAEPAVRGVWAAVDEFLAGTEAGRRPVDHLFAVLRQPPFGLKDGVLPVVLAAVLAHAQAEVALYEDDTFVPRPTAAVFERLVRTPGRFAVQRFRVAGPRAEVFRRYAALVRRPAGDRADLLAVVKPLVRLVRDLPEHAARTERLSDAARKVLRAVREARQPDRLLFADLPAACGHPGFGASGAADPTGVDVKPLAA